MMNKYEKLEKIIEEEDIEKFEEMIKQELEFNDVKILLEIIRKKRLEQLYDKLKIDKEEWEKKRTEKIKLDPKSGEWPLLSSIYKDKKGKYKVEDLMFEYHDSILRDGVIIGMEVGQIIAIHDIQNGKLKKEDIITMSEEDINEYINRDLN